MQTESLAATLLAETAPFRDRITAVDGFAALQSWIAGFRCPTQHYISSRFPRMAALDDDLSPKIFREKMVLLTHATAGRARSRLING